MNARSLPQWSASLRETSVKMHARVALRRTVIPLIEREREMADACARRCEWKSMLTVKSAIISEMGNQRIADFPPNPAEN